MLMSNDLFNQGNRQVETIQVAPDGFVIVNGSTTVSNGGDTYDIRNDITEINTSLSIEAVPGSAFFTLSIPSYDTNKLKAYKGMQVMSEIEMYLRGRFLKKSETGSDYYPYYCAFWGIITSVTENYNEGIHTINVSCADILRWWQVTNININPSLLGSTESLEKYLHAVFDMSHKDYLDYIGTLMTNGSVTLREGKQEGRQISIFGNIYSGMTIPDILQDLAQASIMQLAPVSDYLDFNNKNEAITSETRDMATTQLMMAYWARRMTQIGNNLKIYGLQQRKSDGKWIINLGKVGDITPYPTLPSSVAVAKTERKSKLEVANEMKEAIIYEFFMDVNGDIIFKPPFFNLDVRQNLASVIDDIDIVTWTISQIEAEVVTRVDVTGAIASVSSYQEVTNGIAEDPYLTLQFGERIAPRQMNWLYSNTACQVWAKLELARATANVRQGTMTIIGRPELRMGYPVYVPSRDCFYYIKGIDNNFSFGGNFTTTLTVMAERRRGDKLGILRNVGETKGEQTVVSGTSDAEPNEINNYIKQIYTPTVCSPRTKQTVDVVKPNFAIDLSQISSDTMGKWERFSDVKADVEKGEIQLTNEEGFEIVGATSIKVTEGKTTKIIRGSELDFCFAKGLVLNENGMILQENKTSTNAANQANVMKISDRDLVINANNTARTLEEIKQKIDNATKASIAQNLTPGVNK
jgi:hypothetical protein